jgi:hypothetical protein
MGYFDLYRQALKTIDAQGIPNNSPDYYPAVRKLHKELVDEHKPTDLPIWNGYDPEWERYGWDGDWRPEP